ncbi:hypothetical protein BAUCODRAFT_70819 [Baudoinia panamericana UAMH 10762]|uniref:NAD-dependent epimerase/dehydratase domain-containing protein n=1 Tax=Baudoinia panamericana (strain UAMH 10762) TaxID=717646 RepID=M2MG63_BAUPA|nr:uncharacterized protein BAUCODRAFT_70819 [Baudoinia panamericana UAMH 10762]EMC95616.1 hypothetical protein BAUCODRAFT_70819 [Baudoinia panamericana UAMH 10762]
MAGNLVLITGVSGHIGFRVLRYALEYGYQVRAAVRSEEKANIVRNNAVLKAMGKDSQLSFTIIPDFSAANAFDEAAKGAKYVIHVASPLATRAPADGDYQKGFIDPAVNMTLSMLDAARKAGSIKRVVITSSVVAIMPITAMFEPSGEVYTADTRVDELTGPLENPMAGYVASKIAAFNRAEAWIKNEKPAFDVIHVHPSFVEGRDDLCDSTEYFLTSTNALIVRQALGMPSYFPAAPNNYNHVDDSARIHVQALDPHVEGNQSFVVSNNGEDGMQWSDVAKHVRQHFPEAVEKGILPLGGELASVITKLDNSKTEKTFGKLATFEECVVSVMGHWLELYDKEHALKN